MYFHFIFMLEAILGVDLDLSTLYHGYFMFLGAFEGYSARVASYKKASAPSLSNHNSHLWRITSICLLSSFLIMEYLCAPLGE
jgi:hypothetical protein